MLRNLVIVQLIAALLASQWLCCCTTLALLSDTNPRPRAAGELSGAAKRHSCCSHRKAAQSPEKPTKPDPGRRNPGEKKPDCPCKCKLSKAQLSVPDSDGVPIRNGLRLALADFNPLNASDVVLDATGFAGASVRDPVPWPGPTLTTEDLLFSHHNLRC
jgi:hypothetical protein